MSIAIRPRRRSQSSALAQPQTACEGWRRTRLPDVLLRTGQAGTAEAPRAAARTINSGREPSMDWRSQAACLTVDPELFFPVGNTGPAIAQIAEAKQVCARCDVVDTCLKWALENGQDAGVWGGMSEDERRSLKRRAARARRSS